MASTIMDRTADPTDFKQTGIDTVHNEGKPQLALLKKLADLRMMYRSILKDGSVKARKIQWLGLD